MLITEYLKLDHARFRQLLDIMEEALKKNRASAKVGIVDTLKEMTALEKVHEGIEDQLMMPALVASNKPPPKALSDNFDAAHRDIRKRIADVELCCKEDYPLATISRAVLDYAAAFRDHMRAEEKMIFPLADELLTPAESARLTRAALERESGLAQARARLETGLDG